MKDKTTRRNISITHAIWEKIKESANKSEHTASAWVRVAIQEKLEREGE